jgi:DUF971 family protein
VSIDRIGETAIEIKWSDGTVSSWTVAQLRKACPCATCREKKGSPLADPPEQKNTEQKTTEQKNTEQKMTLTLPVLSASEARPLRIESMRPVGRYAYSIEFSDGHSSGIFPFAMLHEPMV